MKRILLFILSISLLILVGLWHWHSLERKKLEDQYIQNQIETVVKPKQQQVEKIFNSLYQNLRTITLLPSVRSIQGGNRSSEQEDIVSSGRFTEEGWETVQQIYNNLATNVSVSEIYAVIEGLDYTKGQVPFFMFDTLVFGAESGETSSVDNPDFPDESEDDEYNYFPKQITEIKSNYSQFNFSRMDDIPAHLSPLMRTCDNSQYLSKTQGNERETFGILYSVPFYNQKSGQLKGVISAIIRANVFEATLMDVPFVPVTEKDLIEQTAAKWQLPEPSRFLLSNQHYGVQILDRRNNNLEKDLKAGIIGRNVFHIKLNVHSDAEWQLSYFLPEQSIQDALAESDKAFLILVWVIFGVLLLASLSVVLVARTRARLGGKPEVVANVVNAVSQGNLNVTIPENITSDSVLGSMARMLEQLRTSADQAQENQRIRQALDNVSTCVMIADHSRKIIYLNPALQSLLQTTKSVFAQIIPGFSVDQVMGMNLEKLHPTPSHQITKIDTLQSTEEDNIIINDCHFRLIANPIFDEAKQRLGTVIVWTDRTQDVIGEQREKNIKEEVSQIISAAGNGDFSHRIKTESQEGFFKILADGMNRLLDSNAQALEELGIVLSALAQGDLTQRMTSDYQGALGKLKADSNATVDHLTEIITQLSTAATSINTASREIALGNSDLSQRTERQAAGIQQTAASMEELSTTVQQNADNANQANKKALTASQIAAKGGMVVQEVITSMSEISESSRKIYDTIGIIDGIAFQTNILALNAAVEAARAQEQGRGFAVVATEVRTLAQRCALAAKEIKTAIETSGHQVKHGTKLVTEAGQTMGEIVTSVNSVTQIMSEIAQASAEQSSGIEMVKRAIHEMDEMTQQNATLVEEANAASQTLKAQADNLSHTVSMFKF